MRKKILVVFSLILIITLFCGCGWRLRGSALALSGDYSVYVTARDVHGTLITDLKRQLEASEIQLVEQADKAQFRIEIVEERNRRRAVSVNSSALAAEYELTQEVIYQVTANGDESAASNYTASVIRSFNFNENEVVSKAEEERLLREEMRRDLVQQILRRLQLMVTKFNSERASDSNNPRTTPRSIAEKS